MPDHIVRLAGRSLELFEMLTDSLHDIDNHLSRIADSAGRLADMSETALAQQPKLDKKTVEKYFETVLLGGDLEGAIRALNTDRAAADSAPATKKQP